MQLHVVRRSLNRSNVKFLVQAFRHSTCAMSNSRSEIEYGPQRLTKGRKDVVTAVVRKHQEDAFLLVQRSSKVSSYQGYWGGVSGGVEGNESLVSRAQLEILEEVGLHEDQIHLIRSGRTLYVDDGPRRKFAVHPFLFQIIDPNAKPNLNWENDTFSYRTRDEVQSIQTVPKMLETIDRVVISEEQERELERIAKDRSHGAAELASWVCDALESEIHRQRQHHEKQKTELPGKGTEDRCSTLDAIRNYAYHLAACRPSMSSLANVTAMIMSIDMPVARDGEKLDDSASIIDLLDSFEKKISEVRGILKQLASQLLEQNLPLSNENGKNTIFTLSKSSSVTAMIKKEISRNPNLQVFVAESRPLFEGVEAAKGWIHQSWKNVTIFTDAQIGVAIKNATLVIVGADSISSCGVSNKVGTRLAALVAHAENVPIYALSDTLKISPGPIEKLAHPGDNWSNNEYNGEEKEADEITSSWPDGISSIANQIKIRNIYFEETPLELFTGIITESGKLTKKDVDAQVASWKAMYAKAFDLEIET